MKIKKLEYKNIITFQFYCPGCKCIHSLNNSWNFNNDYDNEPTFNPSILVTGRGDPNYRCHSFIREGKIQFLSDCSHELKSQTIDLPEFKEEENDL
jgi:hypothetical protein